MVNAIQFKYYVLNYNHNEQKVKPYNIFNNVYVQEHTEKVVRKYLRNPKKFTYKSFDGKEEIYGFDAFVRELDGIIQWQEWGRSEYEMSCGYAFETDCEKLEKVDCYYQAHANIEIIAREVLFQYKQQKKNMKEGD